jgi:hypothetical protein
MKLGVCGCIYPFEGNDQDRYPRTSRRNTTKVRRAAEPEAPTSAPSPSSISFLDYLLADESSISKRVSSVTTMRLQVIRLVKTTSVAITTASRPRVRITLHYLTREDHSFRMEALGKVWNGPLKMPTTTMVNYFTSRTTGGTLQRAISAVKSTQETVEEQVTFFSKRMSSDYAAGQLWSLEEDAEEDGLYRLVNAYDSSSGYLTKCADCAGNVKLIAKEEDWKVQKWEIFDSDYSNYSA